MPQISFQAKNCCFLAEFNNSSTARDIVARLPIDAAVSVWGDEIYFETGITASCDGAALSLAVEAGDVAYWPQGGCLCVFFGPTPLSKSEKPQPASPVVVIGKTTHSSSDLRKIKAGEPIRVVDVQENIPTAPKGAQIPDKKLSQGEIDVLVRQLLAQKAGKG